MALIYMGGGKKMRYVYVLVFCAAVCVGAYLAGVRNGAARCRERQSTAALATQIQIIKQTEKINEDVMRTSLGDIRRVLREKYTIAD